MDWSMLRLDYDHVVHENTLVDTDYSSEDGATCLAIRCAKKSGDRVTLYYDWSCSELGWLKWKMTNDEYIGGFVK